MYGRFPKDVLFLLDGSNCAQIDCNAYIGHRFVVKMCLDSAILRLVKIPKTNVPQTYEQPLVKALNGYI